MTFFYFFIAGIALGVLLGINHGIDIERHRR